ncbi:hypothetical protein LguiB_005926 [Lonicera macranthoides]
MTRETRQSLIHMLTIGPQQSHHCGLLDLHPWGEGAPAQARGIGANAATQFDPWLCAI